MHDRVKPINSFPLFPILYSYENVLFKVYTTVWLTSSLDVPALKPNHIWAIHTGRPVGAGWHTLTITNDGNIVTSVTSPTSLPLSSGTAGIFKYDVTGNRLWAVGPMAGPDYIAGKLPPGFCPCVGGYGVIERIARTSPAQNGGVTFVGNAWSGCSPWQCRCYRQL